MRAQADDWCYASRKAGCVVAQCTERLDGIDSCKSHAGGCLSTFRRFADACTVRIITLLYCSEQRYHRTIILVIKLLLYSNRVTTAELFLVLIQYCVVVLSRPDLSCS